MKDKNLHNIPKLSSITASKLVAAWVSQNTAPTNSVKLLTFCLN